MENNILFSIVIPTYNRASFIVKTISSLLSQSYSNFEIIVIDDGSSDNTREMISSISDSRFFYFYKKNEERGAARNFGARKASGKYINFFDSDDTAYPNHLEIAFETVLKHNNPEVFHLGYDIKNMHGHLQHSINNFTGDLSTKLIKKGNLLSCNGVFIRKDIFFENLFNEDRELSGSEDYELWLRLVSKYHLFYSNEITSSIYNHDDRSVLNMNKEKLILRFNLLIKYLKENPDFIKKFGKSLNILRSNTYSYISLHISLTGKNKLITINFLLKSFFMHPKVIFSKRFFAIFKHLILTYN